MEMLSVNPSLTPKLIESRWGAWEMGWLSLNPVIFKVPKFSFMNWEASPFTKQ